MTVIPVLVLCSLALVVCAVLLFLYTVGQGDHEHADRLALLPLEDDAPAAACPEPRQPDPPAAPASPAPGRGSAKP